MNISIKLGDKKSLKKAVNEMIKYASSLTKKCDIFIQKVGDLGINIANTYISQYEVPPYIASSIKLERGDILVGSSIKIILDEEDALFWEYGTGQVGAGSPHPQKEDWIYMFNKNRNYEKGWYYKNGEQTKYSKYDNEKGLYWTMGMPAQPFMWKTYNDLLYQKWNEILNIAREVFR